MVPLDRALVSSYRLSIVTKSIYLQRFGRNLQRKYLEAVPEVYAIQEVM